MANPAPTINQINAFNATQGTTIDFNIIGGTELVRSNKIYIYDLSDNSLICTHLYVSTESIHELPPNTDGSIVYESGKSSADFVNGKQYYAQIQTFTDIAGTQGGSGLSVSKLFWCLVDPSLTIATIPSSISTTSYNVSATYNANTSVVSNIIQQYQFSLYSATGSLLQSSGVIVGSGTQQGTSTAYDISYNFIGLSVGSSYYVTVEVTTTQGMSVTTQSNTFTVSIDTPTLGEATVVNNACDGYISVTSNLSGEYGGSGSGEIVSFETDSENVFTKLQVAIEPTQSGSGTPSPSNVRPLYGVGGVEVNVVGKNLFDPSQSEQGYIDDADGVLKGTSSVSMRSTGWVVVESGANYFITSPQPTGQWGAWYDANKTYISGFTNYSTAKTAPSNAKYLRVTVNSGGTNPDYATNVMIAKGSATSEYEPYTEQTVSQEFDVSLTPTSKDTDPYLFKAVGDIYGDRLEEDIVGGMVNWNQLAGDLSLTQGTQSGITITKVNNTTFTISGTATARLSVNMVQYIPVLTNHVYLLCGMEKNTQNIGTIFNAFNGSTYVRTYSGMDYGDGLLIKNTDANVNMCHYEFVIANGTALSKTYTIRPNYVDLTAFFGNSAIADYVYNLETANAGAGIAWLRKYFPDLFAYSPYNTGTFESVKPTAHVTRGVNQWDEVAEYGGINSTDGQNITSSTTQRSTNYIPVFPSTTYYLKSAQKLYYRFYDADKNYIGQRDVSNIASGYNTTMVTPSNCAYFRFVTDTAIASGSICINISDPDINGKYFSYEEHTYDLGNVELRGIPKLDANNDLYYDGDTYESDGTVTRKYGIVDLGSLTWSLYKTNGFSAKPPNAKPASGLTPPNVVASKLFNWQGSSITLTDGMATIAGQNTGANVYIVDANYSDATTFKSAMSGVYLVYELATPTTETTTPFTQIQEVSKYGTLEYITTNEVPVGHNTTYLTRDIFGGYIDFVSGELVVDKKLIDLGTLTYSIADSGHYGLSNALSDAKAPQTSTELANILCSDYMVDTQQHVYDKVTNGTIALAINGTVRIYDTSITASSGAEFATKVSGKQLCYELATPQTYQLTPQQIQTLVGVNNVWSEQGDVELSYHIPITNLLVKRQDVDDVSGDWLTLYSQPVTQASDMDFTFIDFLNQYGKTYKYALVPLLTQTQSGVEVEVEGGYTVSDEVQSIFDGVYIGDSTVVQRLKAGVAYNNLNTNQQVGVIPTLGNKYPVIVSNGNIQYDTGSVSGLIVPDDFYSDGNLSRLDMSSKREAINDFLTNKKPKILKDWNGNIWLVVFTDNVDVSFDNNYGMGVATFTSGWTEVGDPTNQEDLQRTGLINVGGD